MVVPPAILPLDAPALDEFGLWLCAKALYALRFSTVSCGKFTTVWISPKRVV